MKATISFLFDSRRNQKGVYTLCWNIYFNGKQKPFSTGLKLSEEEVKFLKASKNGIDGRLKDANRRNLWDMVYGRTYIDVAGSREDSCLYRAEKVINSLNPFSFEEFKLKINGKHIEGINGESEREKFPDDLLACLHLEFSKLRNLGQIGGANSHRDARSSIVRFLQASGRDADQMPYKKLTSEFLNEYERWMLKEGKAPKSFRTEKNLRLQEKYPSRFLPKPASEATIGIYSRYFRKMALLAVKVGYITESEYPFKGDGGFIIPEIENAARSLDLDDILRFVEFIPDLEIDKYHHDLWVFSYLSNGLNMTDIANLKWRNYDQGAQVIRFFREKTKRTTKKSKTEIHISVFAEAAEIIRKWGTPGGPDQFIFPILDGETDPARQKALISNQIKKANKSLGTISDQIGLPFHLRTNDARDSQATVLMQAGAPLPFIQRSMGHKKLTTTQRYFGRFSDPKTKSILSALLPKKEE